MARIVLGKYKFVVDVSFLLVNFGIILSCMLTLNDFMCGLFKKQFFGKTSDVFSHKDNLFWIIVPNISIIPIILKNNNKTLNILSALSVFAYVLLGFFCFYLFSKKIDHFDSNGVNFTRFENPIGIFILLMFGFMNQQYLIDTFGQLKCKKTTTLNHVLKIQYGLLSFIYLSIAIFGYLSFYDRKDINQGNIFAYDLPKNFFCLTMIISIAFSLIINILSTSSSTKDHLVDYLKNIDNDPKMSFFTVVCQ